MSLYRFNAEAKFAFVQNNIIQNHLPWKDWQQIGLGEILLKIDDLDFSAATAKRGTGTATGTATATACLTWTRCSTETVTGPAMSAMAVAMATAMATAGGLEVGRERKHQEDRKECWKQWDENLSIAGGIYLSPNSKLIFVSCIDLKYFTKL